MALKTLEWFFVSIFFLTLGVILHGTPLDPDRRIEFLQLLGVFFIFTFFWMGLLSWGRIFKRLVFPSESHLIHDLGLGTIFFILLSFGFSELGWIGYSMRPGLISFLCLGTFLGSRLFSFRSCLSIFQSLSPLQKVLFFLVIWEGGGQPDIGDKQ